MLKDECIERKTAFVSINKNEKIIPEEVMKSILKDEKNMGKPVSNTINGKENTVQKIVKA